MVNIAGKALSVFQRCRPIRNGAASKTPFAGSVSGRPAFFSAKIPNEMQTPGAERHRHKEDRGNARRFPGNRQVQPNPRRGMRRFARPARYCKASARRFGTSQDAHDLLSMAIIPRMPGAFVKCRFHILTHSSSYAGGRTAASAAGLCRLSITPVCRGKNDYDAAGTCADDYNPRMPGEEP